MKDVSLRFVKKIARQKLKQAAFHPGQGLSPSGEGSPLTNSIIRVASNAKDIWLNPMGMGLNVSLTEVANFLQQPPTK